MSSNDRYSLTSRQRPRGKPPATIMAWGLGTHAGVGHNNGPPLEDEAPGYLWRRYRWQNVHAAAWKPPSYSVAKFRVARAAAAGVTYEQYVAALLDTGRFTQARDRDEARIQALARVRTAWQKALGDLAPAAPRMQASIVLVSLTGAYDEARRAYHGIRHIAAVLDDLERHGRDAEDNVALAMAALFHDVIYDATRGDNETESARLAALHLGDLGVPAPRIARVTAMILATRHRPEDVASADADTALLLDCDLAVLAASQDRYAAYAKAIRCEYAHVPDADFRSGRAKVLAAFLARDCIYATAALARLWEASARANMAAERMQLLGAVDPPLTQGRHDRNARTH